MLNGQAYLLEKMSKFFFLLYCHEQQTFDKVYNCTAIATDICQSLVSALSRQQTFIKVWLLYCLDNKHLSKYGYCTVMTRNIYQSMVTVLS